MSAINHYQQGMFCWAELCTQDWAQAKLFYTSVFNWGIDDQPLGDGAYYTMLKQGSDDIAAMYQMASEQISAGVTSHWLSYIAVDDVHACAHKVTALGAQIIAGPHEVGSAGKMLLLRDPGGALVALWQAVEHAGCQRQYEFNTPYWYELATRDASVSRDFYCQLIGWQYEIKPMDGMDYTLFLVDGKPVAGMLEMDEQWPQDTPAHWMLYFAVENCNATVTKATQSNAQLCVPATDIPEIGRFSVLCDPQGAVFSIIQSSQNDVTAG